VFAVKSATGDIIVSLEKFTDGSIAVGRAGQVAVSVYKFSVRISSCSSANVASTSGLILSVEYTPLVGVFTWVHSQVGTVPNFKREEVSIASSHVSSTSRRFSEK